MGETIELSDEHFRCNRHSPTLIVGDNISLVPHEKYCRSLKRTTTHNELYSVGSREREEFQSRSNEIEPLGFANVFPAGRGSG